MAENQQIQEENSSVQESTEKRNDQRWTPEEDALLRAGIEKYPPSERKWSLIASEFVKTKNGQQCRTRWTNVLDPEIAKGKFSSEEIERLQNLVIQYYKEQFPALNVDAVVRREESWPQASISWPDIAMKVGTGRTSTQCHSCWYSKGDPSLIRGRNLTESELNVLKSVMVENEVGNYVEASRLTHRSVDMLTMAWKKMQVDYDTDDLSFDDQFQFFRGLQEFGEFNNNKIRDKYLPRRTANYLFSYWEASRKPLMEILMKRFAGSTVALSNEEELLSRLQSADLSVAEVDQIVEQLSTIPVIRRRKRMSSSGREESEQQSSSKPKKKLGRSSKSGQASLDSSAVNDEDDAINAMNNTDESMLMDTSHDSSAHHHGNEFTPAQSSSSANMDKRPYFQRMKLDLSPFFIAESHNLQQATGMKNVTYCNYL